MAYANLCLFYNRLTKKNILTNKIQKAIQGGLSGTAVMTVVTLLAPLMGMPKMSPPEMLSTMLGFPILVGWIMHFTIGVIFALAYAYFFYDWVRKVSNNMLRGAIFGLAAFIFAQIMLAIMGMMFPMPAMEGSIVLVMIGSIVGHIVFGITVALFVKE